MVVPRDSQSRLIFNLGEVYITAQKHLLQKGCAIKVLLLLLGIAVPLVFVYFGFMLKTKMLVSSAV